MMDLTLSISLILYLSLSETKITVSGNFLPSFLRSKPDFPSQYSHGEIIQLFTAGFSFEVGLYELHSHYLNKSQIQSYY